MTPAPYPARIAIVDDEDAVRKSLRRLLRVAGFEGMDYASGTEFLQACSNNWPHCALIDLQMPGLTGIETQERLTRAGIHLPVIIITAHADAVVRERCTALGIRALLLKPFDGEQLLSLIASIVGNARTDSQC